ncbi:MAG TPA: ABC transporter permease [Aggregatilinea sp.]|jgi:peptide/nickel transport system permease protein|uniref:ABC transporter permease n=1 Tax=Aggregatilinea sp. TaxID=2806333 RepID=UPI002B8609ED|nr:ABC transporter permease [Aggregatilinea sp.]HML21892.1 ABC transporter permease [Aggregatilinea sp.]
MVGYLARRLALSIPVLLGILFVTFSLARLLPGDPCRSALGERATPQICDAFNERYGLNDPIPEQFRIYIRDVLHGDLGDSIKFGRPVNELLVERLPVTVELTFYAMMFAILVGVPSGVISAYYHNSAIDVGTMIGANVGVSMPVFWLGLMLSYLFGVVLKDSPLWLPPSGRLSAGLAIEPFYQAWGIHVSDTSAFTVPGFIANINTLNALLVGDWHAFGDALQHMILPAVALGTIPMSLIARMTRSSLLEVLGLNYVRTARAKGVHEVGVVLRHGLRNAMLPVVTIIGLSLGSLLSGAVLTETIFGLSGVGRVLYDAITGRDYTVVQAFTLIIAVIFVFINLVVDTLYAYLDPRIRLE